MKILLGIDVTLEVQKTLEAAKVIADITAADPPVVTTGGAHGYATGDWVVLDVPSGMYQIDAQLAQITVLSSTTFALDGVEASGNTAYYGSDGEVRRVTAWEPLDNGQDWAIDEADPDRLPVKNMHRSRKQTVLGQEGELTGTLNITSNPEQPAVRLMRQARRTQSRLAQRLTYANGDVVACNAEWAGGRGVRADPEQVSSSRISFTVKGEPVFYFA
jgi:hypothetical protein